jgi:hypothetical protein
MPLHGQANSQQWPKPTACSGQGKNHAIVDRNLRRLATFTNSEARPIC